MVTVLASILGSTLSSQVTKEYAVTALMKLTTRFSTCTEQIQYVINNYTTNTDVELQQRSVEFDTIFRKYESLRPGLLERMPVIKNESSEKESNGEVPVNGHATETEKSKMEPVTSLPPQQQSDSLLDLLGDGPIESSVPVAQPNAEPSASLMDLLGDLDTGSNPPVVASPARKSLGNITY